MVLQTVAERMTRAARSLDTVCRLGGDEFVVVLRGTVDDPIRRQDKDLRVGASVGVAASDGSTADALLIRADRAVYRAKAEGRGLVRF